MRDFHCALGKTGSFTDPVGNWVLIAGVELDQDLANIIQGGKYPYQCMPDFLHEVVHHMCFNSPVGATLACLRLRAIRQAAEHVLHSSSTVDLDKLADDVIRYETAIALLRPLNEGLALYGEFDAFPASSKVMSDVTNLAALNFAKPRNAEEKIDVFAQRALFEFRQLRLFQDRKANLLVQPLTTKNGGYLPGYLVVKNLWHQLVFNRGVTPLLDTDLFLLYLRTFIYDDLGFVDVLLSPEHSLKPNQEGDSSQAIADYFFTRISECSQLTTKEVASRVEAAILNGGASYYDDVQVGTSPEQARRGKKRFEDLLADFESGSADKTEELLRLREYQIRIIKQRRFICIASFAAPVEVNEKGRVLVGQQIGRDGQTRPLFGLSGRSGLRQAKGSGSVECFLCARPRLSVMTVNLQDEVVAVFSLSEAFDAALAAEVGEMRASLSDALKRKELFAEYLDIALAEPELAHWRKAYANAYEVGIENFYIDKALSRTPEECVETCASTMRETGFYKVLGEDYELVNTFARFSLNSSLARGARALLKDLTDPDHWDFDQLVNEIKTRGLNAHFPLLVDLEDKILFSLV